MSQKLLPRRKWISSAQAIPRSPGKLGEEFFYAITALRTSRQELWRAGYTDCAAVLDEVYSILYAIGAQASARRRQSKSKQGDGQTQ